MSDPGILPELKAVLDLDKTVHEPARLVVLAILLSVESADFSYLKAQTGLTQGNLSAHLGKLENAGLVDVSKSFEGKRPKTTLRITQEGERRLLMQADTLIRFLALIGIHPPKARR